MVIAYRFVIDYRDSILSRELDKELSAMGARVLRTRVRAPQTKAYASYCASLQHSSVTDDTSRRDESFIPCAFLGASRPGGSHRCSGLSL